MDIFKLIFQHDLRLNALRLAGANQSGSGSIEDFLKPDPTYSEFYISGSVIDQEVFGLNQLNHFSDLMKALTEAFSEYNIFLAEESVELREAVENAEITQPIILSEDDHIEWDQKALLKTEKNIEVQKEKLAEVLEAGDLILYKENNHHGFDLHLFSRKNIYTKMFYPLQKMVSNNFRFFSINGKKIRSEKKFYFETWTLERPPHGAEEVFAETVL